MMNIENERLKSFDNSKLWKEKYHHEIDSRLLAMYGFYFIESIDRICCFYCQNILSISLFNDRDELYDEVRESYIYHHFDFIEKGGCDRNIPIIREKRSFILQGSVITYGMYQKKLQNYCNYFGNYIDYLSGLFNQIFTSFIYNDIQYYDKYEYIIGSMIPSYANYKRRFSTFSLISKKKNDREFFVRLCCLGLFVNEYDKCLVCFYCGGTFKNYNIYLDDFKHEHLLWYPDCLYMNNIVKKINIL